MKVRKWGMVVFDVFKKVLNTPALITLNSHLINAISRGTGNAIFGGHKYLKWDY
jgi:hypothetical protein